MPYFNQKGQIENNTNDNTKKITPNIIHFFDSVVSNLKQAYFFYELSGVTGYNTSGYFPLR